MNNKTRILFINKFGKTELLLTNIQSLRGNFQIPNIYMQDILHSLNRAYSSFSKFLRLCQRWIRKKFPEGRGKSHGKPWIGELEQMQNCVLNKEYFYLQGRGTTQYLLSRI